LTIKNYASVLNEIIESLDSTKVYNQALEQVTAAVEEKRDYIKSQVVEAVRSEVEANVTAAVTEQVKAEVTKAVKEQVSEKVTANVRENVEEQVILAATGMNKASYYAQFQPDAWMRQHKRPSNPPLTTKWQVKKLPI